MEQPATKTTFLDEENKVAYVIVAYRTFSKSEGLQAIRAFNARKRKPPAAGSTVIIQTILGFND